MNQCQYIGWFSIISESRNTLVSPARWFSKNADGRAAPPRFVERAMTFVVPGLIQGLPVVNLEGSRVPAAPVALRCSSSMCQIPDISRPPFVPEFTAGIAEDANDGLRATHGPW